MAGKYTRQSYEQDTYNERLARSNNEVLYRLDPNFSVNCDSCFVSHGPRGGRPASTVIGDQIDVDSVLRGINRTNGRSNKQQMATPIDNFEVRHKPNCSNRLEPEYSRFTHPSYDIRGLTTIDLNFDYPLQDPQCQIFENFSVNTRLQSKDNHITTWQVPINQSDLLPVERLGRVKNR